MSQREHAHPPYLGVCVGGPYAGKRIGSYDREQTLVSRARPLSFAEMRQGDREIAIEYKYGAYRFDDDTQHFHWRDLD